MYIIFTFSHFRNTYPYLYQISCVTSDMPMLGNLVVDSIEWTPTTWLAVSFWLELIYTSHSNCWFHPINSLPPHRFNLIKCTPNQNQVLPNQIEFKNLSRFQMGTNTVGGRTQYGAKLASFPLTNEKAKARKAEPLLQKLGKICL